MLNLILTIAMQTTVPVYCQAVFADRPAATVECSCGVTAQNLKKRVCTSEKAEGAFELKEVTK